MSLSKVISSFQLIPCSTPLYFPELLTSGYQGVIAIEPHVAAVVHQTGVHADERQMYASYLRYARQWQDLLQEAAKGSTPRWIVANGGAGLRPSLESSQPSGETK